MFVFPITVHVNMICLMVERACVPECVHVRRSKDNFVELVLSIHLHVGSRDWWLGLWGKGFSSLSCLTSLVSCFIENYRNSTTLGRSQSLNMKMYLRKCPHFPLGSTDNAFLETWCGIQVCSFVNTFGTLRDENWFLVLFPTLFINYMESLNTHIP